MAFPRPTLRALVERAISDFSSRTNGSAYIKRSPERVLAQVTAALTHGLHGHLDWLQRQFFPTTASIESLLGWGAWLKIPRKGVDAAVGTAVFEAEVGTSIPLGVQMQTSDGIVFQTTAASYVADGRIIAPIVAVEAGTLGNFDSGAGVALIVPIAGVDSNGELLEATSGGIDTESVEDYRVRILNGLRTPPAGGGPGDYVAWALEVDGVTRAWEYGNRMGYGTVSVSFVMDERVSRIPLPADIAEVQAHIDSKRPLDVREVYVVAPIIVPTTILVQIKPNTEAVRQAITTELLYLFEVGTELGEPLPLSKIDEAISTAQGEEDHVIISAAPLDPGQWGLLQLGDGAIQFYDIGESP